MTVVLSRVSVALLGAALLAASGAACARNDKLLLPVDVAMRNPATRAVLGSDIALRFGRASGGGETAVVQVHSVADPFSSPTAAGNRFRRADEVVCQDAFRKALAELQQRARTQGGVAVLGIVSNYGNVEFDSREVYECHIGHSRGVVDLKGVVSRTLQPVAATPVAVRAPQAHLAPLPAAAADPVQPPRIASGFAAIDDLDAIPYLSDRGRQDYRNWLAMPTPKAFAISSTGHYFYASGLKPKDTTLPTDPNERAVAGCERNAKAACKLYAVNGSVVWGK